MPGRRASSVSRRRAEQEHKGDCREHTAVSCRARGQPAAAGQPAAGPHRSRRRPVPPGERAAEVRSAETARRRRDHRRREAAGKRRPAGRDRRRVPPPLVVPGFSAGAVRHGHSVGRRRQDDLRGAAVSERHDSREAAGPSRARDRQAQAHEGDLHRALRVLEKADDEHAEDQHSVAEHAALLGRPRCHRRDGLSRHRRVLERRCHRVDRRNRGSCGARLHLHPDRRRDVSAYLRSARTGRASALAATIPTRSSRRTPASSTASSPARRKA